MNKRIEFRYRSALLTWKVGVCFVGIMWLNLMYPALAEDRTTTVDNASPAVTNRPAADDFTTIRDDLLRMENRLRQVTDTNTQSLPKGVNKGTGQSAQGSMGMDKGMKMDKGMGMDKGMKMDMGMGMDKGMDTMAPDTTSSAMGGMRMMSMMGKQPDSTVTDSPTGLPGVAGAAHLYHLGEQEFFLDQAHSISLSTQQTEQLESIRLQWQTRNQEMEKKIEVLEEQLWQQTAMGKPDRQAIAKTIRDTENLRGDLRLAFIDSVGNAVNILSREQIDKLITLSSQSPQ